MFDLIASGYGRSICMLSAQFVEESNMAVYQCFFFSGGRVSYWENVKCDGRMPLTAALGDRLKNGKWNRAEAWSDEQACVRSAPPASGQRRRYKVRIESLCSEVCGIGSSARAPRVRRCVVGLRTRIQEESPAVASEVGGNQGLGDVLGD